MNYLLIGLGGALGAICRYYLGLLITKRSNYTFPFGTLFINITGSFLLGFILNLYIHQYIQDWVMLFLGVGFCGAYTTFSTFGNETVQLFIAKQSKTAILYIGASLFVTFMVTWLGLII